MKDGFPALRVDSNENYDIFGDQTFPLTNDLGAFQEFICQVFGNVDFDPLAIDSCQEWHRDASRHQGPSIWLSRERKEEI
jgi:hypothetical protein